MHKQTRDRLAIADDSLSNHLFRLQCLDKLYRNSFARFQMLGVGDKIAGDVHVHQFVGKPRRCIKFTQTLHRCGSIASFLLQFPGCGMCRILTRLKFSRGKLPKHFVYRDSFISDHDEATVIEQGNHHHRPRMADDFPGEPATLLISPGYDLNFEQAAVMSYLSMKAD